MRKPNTSIESVQGATVAFSDLTQELGSWTNGG
jgi:hypothetical protein